ncbi:MAG: nascent polypeptide-associated complex protein [Thermoplasmatales archaeon]|jgi:nascent polypeptide-associated complex subunit alpha
MIKGRVNERQVKRMMQQMGIKSNDLDDVVEVRIVLKDKTIIIKEPNVSVIEVQGNKTYTVVGKEEIIQGQMDKQTIEDTNLKEEDIKLVMEKAGVTREKAIEALKSNNYMVAEAIIYCMTKR